MLDPDHAPSHPGDPDASPANEVAGPSPGGSGRMTQGFAFQFVRLLLALVSSPPDGCIALRLDLLLLGYPAAWLPGWCPPERSYSGLDLSRIGLDGIVPLLSL